MIFEPILNEHKIRYTIMQKFVEEHFKEGSKLNIYINLDSIFKKLYRPAITEGIDDMNEREKMELTSAVINLVSHYRHFFWNRYQVPTRFYFYFMNQAPYINQQFHPGYMKNTVDKKRTNHPDYGGVNRTILLNMKYISMISIFIQDCYCIPNNGIEPALIPYHIMQKDKDNTDICHLILTKDEFDYQLLNAAKNTLVLRMKYTDSYMITKETIYHERLSKVKYRPETSFNPKLYSLLLAFSGVKSREVKAIKGYGMVNVMKKLDKAFRSGLLPNKYMTDMLTLCDAIDCAEIFGEVKDRFTAIDLKTNYKMLSSGALEGIELCLLDRYDNSSIMELNDKYFRNNPLELIRLEEGVGY